MMVSTLASSSPAMVSSRRCCCVRAMSDKRFRGLADAGPQKAAGFRCRSVAIAELTVPEDDGAVDAGRDDGGIVAVDHPGQAAVEGHLLLAILIDRVVKAGGVDHDEVGTLTFAQRACRKPEPVGDFSGQPVNRMSDRHEGSPGPLGIADALEQFHWEVVER